MKFIYLFFAVCLMASQSQAQELKISGTVTEPNSLPLPGVSIIIKGTNNGTQTDIDGFYELSASEGQILKFSYLGFISEERTVKKGDSTINIILREDLQALEEIVVTGYAPQREVKALGYAVTSVSADYMQGKPRRKSKRNLRREVARVRAADNSGSNVSDNESYARIQENIFKRVETAPLSTFSIDVDKAGYSNVRRMINNGQKVPVDAVKIEEMINYFSYNYQEPKKDEPFSINTEVAMSPWNKQAKLVKIGLKGRDIQTDGVPGSNLVFLIDVSGSMGSENKLGLLKPAFEVMVNQLREQDRVSIVVYAGAAGLVLPPTNGLEKETIMNAINNLRAGGSTAGGQGIELAYKIAQENFIKNGNNRVILATDGDFNVGASSDRSMEDLIVEKRKSGVFLTVLGFGMGNYKDSKMETLADKGNGNYAYIDTMQEARKTLGVEFFGTMYVIAKDVKLQVEFNPAKVQAYRLVGYENRLLNDEDFQDDTKDAGELGSGHTVTALYEIIPVGVKSDFVKDIPNLKYTKATVSENATDLLTVKFRYKEPSGDKSKLLVQSVIDTNKDFEMASEDFKFSAAVALFGMQLRKSVFTNTLMRKDVVQLAQAGIGEDQEGYRAEFLRLVKSY